QTVCVTFSAVLISISRATSTLAYTARAPSPRRRRRGRVPLSILLPHRETSATECVGVVAVGSGDAGLACEAPGCRGVALLFVSLHSNLYTEVVGAAIGVPGVIAVRGNGYRSVNRMSAISVKQ